MINNQDITFVVQGPQFIRKGNNYSLAVLKSIEKYYPGAQIIFSTTDTTIDSRIRNITDCSVISINDVGSLKMEGLNPQNSNRQIYGTSKGLENCTTKWVCKTRSDVYFEKWFDFQKVLDKFPLFSDIDKVNFSGTKIVVSNVTSKRFTSDENYLHHVSDWFYFGKTEVIKEIFSVPLINELQDKNLVRYISCEQYIWESWARKYLLDDFSVLGAESFLVTNAIIIDACDLGFKSFKRGYSIPFGLNGYYGMHHIDWVRLYSALNNQNGLYSRSAVIFSLFSRVLYFIKYKLILEPLVRLKNWLQLDV